ncbi:hypothetical protein EDB89DRAFT_1294705 [Lactarius sanguifluus]|nr:hypothetical protein EDB89DRAFT_1294705 [Lactarius sanguifluus]
MALAWCGIRFAILFHELMVTQVDTLDYNRLGSYKLIKKEVTVQQFLSDLCCRYPPPLPSYPHLFAALSCRRWHIHSLTPSSASRSSHATPGGRPSRWVAWPSTRTRSKIMARIRGRWPSCCIRGRTTCGLSCPGASSLMPSRCPRPPCTRHTSSLCAPFSRTATTPVDIEHSTFKSLSAFLRASEKGGLLKSKHARSDVQVAAVFLTRADVVTHQIHRTVGEEDERRRRAKEREAQHWQAAKAAKAEKAITVTELWKARSSCRFLKISDST